MARPYEESSENSSDRRKKEKTEKKKKKRGKRERRGRGRSQGRRGGGAYRPAWGEVKEDMEGEVVVGGGDRDRDNDEEGVQVVDPTNAPPPPSPSGFPKPWAPSLPPPGKHGRPPVSSGAEAGVRGGSTRFFLPRA